MERQPSAPLSNCELISQFQTLVAIIGTCIDDAGVDPRDVVMVAHDFKVCAATGPGSPLCHVDYFRDRLARGRPVEELAKRFILEWQALRSRSVTRDQVTPNVEAADT